jgi:F-type H+-transporting ATPase subunit b
MDLITPQIGLMFWTLLVFVILMFILTKFAWKPILKSVNDRSQSIEDALALAEKTKKEMLEMQSQNQAILNEARAERDAMMKDATETKNRIIEEAKAAAKTEADKVMVAAKAAIASDKVAALAELKGQVASISLAIAEKLVKGELSQDDKQKALAGKLAEEISLN